MNKKFALGISILAFIGVIIAMIGTAIDSISNPLLSALGTIRYFTIQSNIIVGIAFLLYALLSNSKTKSLIGASVVYITITFLGFSIMLERLWDPEGIPLIGSTFNHYIIPVLSILYILIFRNDFYFKNDEIKKWIIYPLSYLVFLIVFGLSTNDFIYPFLDLKDIGVILFIVSILVIILIFTLISYLLISITRKEKAS
ncbi:Pr6Pr family membrane protein [Candidatus Izemoplasma sp. B36]|uniref:Pr6Pr family membrane protein n=1 Tax=Candidatus Izemoplasma sp. B36 TaxID=3242468 RepID=UPI0035560766